MPLPKPTSAIFAPAARPGSLEQPLFDGIAAVLDRLRAAGWLLGIATGMSGRGLAHCLDSHGLAGHFVTLQTADDHPSKPHPAMLEAALAEAGADPHEAVMIGDTVYDMQMARDAGVRAHRRRLGLSRSARAARGRRRSSRAHARRTRGVSANHEHAIAGQTSPASGSWC